MYTIRWSQTQGNWMCSIDSQYDKQLNSKYWECQCICRIHQIETRTLERIQRSIEVSIDEGQ